MALLPSSLSIAADAIADLVHGWFQAQGLDVLASVDTPVAAAERAKGANASHAVNFFFYRVAPSAFHQGLTAGDPLFLRLFCLVTPFPSKAQNANAEADADLRLLGEVIRLFHGQPVLPPKPDAPGANDTVYRVQANLLAPNMEEINHIWTTQGTELPYRLSAAYEFALVPLEPLTHRQPGPPVTSALLQVDPSLANAATAGFSAEAQAIPLGPVPAADWLPVVLLVDGDRLTSRRQVAPATATLPLALAGRAGAKARLTLTWLDAAATIVGGAATSVQPVKAARLDTPAARLDLPLARPPTAALLRIEAAPAADDGSALPGAPGVTALEVAFA
jgi:hypothetical protein